MAKLIPHGDESNHEVTCSECDAVFTLLWQRTHYHDTVEFCPFCGESVIHEGEEGFKEEEEWDEQELQ